MNIGYKFDLQQTDRNEKGIYACSVCGTALFAPEKKFNSGCGFPSFWAHIGENVRQNKLDTYGRSRIQLDCNQCGLHLGHLFEHTLTPTQVRYCINADAIQLKEVA
ncbi:peptide-methionine (R)-S-oxide reductase [Pontibacter diazotrophicus]|uniref:peptide-methionine (R)-S-oxide reductase n=1 Tax=Pontibacter diazotrophicus TaxID=1400979 RepID=A0A3D8LBX6_9BACT|nr:peptide-methionine (R)-S-oxide reductase [Pontibacter diazotrophicus]RDV14900.1 peptide-methionine (R)-S-oxide reductase [Pontibacter diazotrophicus]